MELKFFKNFKLDYKKTGKDKTNVYTKRYAITLVLLLALSFFVFFMNSEEITSTVLLIFLFFFELIYSCFISLSMRLRKLEEKVEEKQEILKKKNK